MYETLTHPVLQAGEYKDVLKPQQTLNFQEVAKFEQKAGSDNTPTSEMNAMLEDILRQPIMSGAYRQNGIAPQQVEQFIETVKQFPNNRKERMIRQVSALYGLAAHSKTSESSLTTLKVTESEWYPLVSSLANASTLRQPMKEFVTNHKSPEKAKSAGEKIQNWFKEKAADTKTIAAGIVAAVILTPAARHLLSLTAKEDMKKMEINPKQAAKTNTEKNTAYLQNNTNSQYD